MRFPVTMSAAILLFGLALTVGAAGDEKKSLKPTQGWGGIVNDETKQKAAPKRGCLTTQEMFDTLWNEWGLKDKAPKIDFTKQIVFVQIASGPNRMSTGYTLDGKGNLTVISKQTLKAGPGFGYGLDVLDRDGIKSYNGKPLEK